MYDVIIVGAGASGTFCALSLKYNNPNLKVLLLEKNDKLGKKLLITGNGRCNLGNTDNKITNYNSSSFLDKFKTILENNDYDFLNVLFNDDDLDNYYYYLNKFGILIKKEDTSTRLYPYSNQALTICKSFERALEKENVKTRYNYDVKKVVKNQDAFIINDDLTCKKLIIATGGKTYSKTGSTGTGYEILKSFGHTITPIYPSLTSLKTDYKYIKELQGVRIDAVVKLSVDGKIIEIEEGQIQFTKDALSGICVFNLSRNVGKCLNQKKDIKLIVNYIPNYSEEEIKGYLKGFYGYNVETALSCIINNKLANVITKELHLNNKRIKELTDAELERTCFTLKNMYFNINGTGDFENAQVTCGGALLDEFTSDLESKKCKGLYAIGEVLDVDGKCGGYNLSWAFNSALIASKNKV